MVSKRFDARFNKGLELFKSGAYEQAIEEVNALTFSNDSDPRPYLLIAESREKLNQLEAANVYYTKAIKIEQNNMAFENDLIKAVLKRVKPSHVLKYAFFSRAGNWAQLRKLEEAIQDYQMVLKIDPDNEIEPSNADAYHYMGIVKAAKGDLMGAIEDWKKTLAIDPGFQDAQNNINMANEELRQGSSE